MVFQDYELIHTKRVNRERINTDIYRKHIWNSVGGWTTIYMSAATGLAAYQLRAYLCN
jgi:hypothetical protein